MTILDRYSIRNTFNTLCLRAIVVCLTSFFICGTSLADETRDEFNKWKHARIDALTMDVPLLDTKICHVNMSKIIPKAKAWVGTETEFYDKWILPEEFKMARSVARNMRKILRARIEFFPTPESYFFPYDDANLYFDVKCVEDVFPYAYLTKTADSSDPILSYRLAVDDFNRNGCKNSDAVVKRLKFSGDSELYVRRGSKRGKEYRIPYAYYIAGVVVLKCSGDASTDSVRELFNISKARGYDVFFPYFPITLYDLLAPD